MALETLEKIDSDGATGATEAAIIIKFCCEDRLWACLITKFRVLWVIPQHVSSQKRVSLESFFRSVLRSVMDTDHTMSYSLLWENKFSTVAVQIVRVLFLFYFIEVSPH